jgi:hypothetical protein
MPVLLLPAADRQHMIEADTGILLPELQHGLKIVGREPDVDDALCQFHLADRYSNEVPVSFAETSQSFAAAAVSRACGMISAGAGEPRSSLKPPGP